MASMITIEQLKAREKPVAVVGLGYVGLPLAVALAEAFDVVGFDIAQGRVDELREGRDRTGEVAPEVLQAADVAYTADPTRLGEAGLVVVAVPTPIDEHRRPDLGPLTGASATVGAHLAPGAVVVYESTVFPGCTEDVCVPILEERSGLKCGTDFWVGYSPERINPGDKVHTLATIVKVVAGQDQASLELLAAFYATVVRAGIHKTTSIKAAEAAKVIENTQRDLNIALMNELSLIFERLGVDTLEVLEAAGTKWNFLPFRPGLVGGHCIGVDPYYLTFKAESLGLHPQVILAGRRINDAMGSHVAQAVLKRIMKGGCRVTCARIGVMGLTFKENVPDLRNTKVIDVVRELADYGAEVLVHDPMADPAEARREYGLALSGLEAFTDLDALVLAVAHADYAALGVEGLAAMLRPEGPRLLADIKGVHDPAAAAAAGLDYWRL